jgi:hypothetical protein
VCFGFGRRRLIIRPISGTTLMRAGFWGFWGRKNQHKRKHRKNSSAASAERSLSSPSFQNAREAQHHLPRYI